MNVLPILADLSPSTKSDYTSHQEGSSVGEFARMLDRGLSGSGALNSSTQNPATVPDGPYVSPTSSEPERSSQNSNRNPASEPKNRTNPHTPQTPDQPQKASASSRDPASSPKRAGTSPPADGSVRAKKGKNEPSKAGANDGKVKHGTHKKGSKGEKTNPKGGKTPQGPSFPGAIILSGAKALLLVAGGGKEATKKTVATHAQTPNDASSEKKTELPKTGPKAASTTGPDTKKSTAKGVKKAEKTVANPAVSAQLVVGEAPTVSAQGSTAAAAAAHTGPGYSNIQQGPAEGAAAHHPAESQQIGVTIIDLRHQEHNGASNNATGNNQSHSSDGSNVRLFQLAEGPSGAAGRLAGQGAMARASGAPSTGQSFSALTDQIVKQTGILLKNNNAGEIRLVLKPEKLGSLRIKIDMNNNNLTGKILVQNHEALKLVQQNLDGLYRALRDSGFTATALNVSVGGKEGGERNRERSSPLPSMRAIVATQGFENQTPALEAAGNNYSLVNLVI